MSRNISLHRKRAQIFSLDFVSAVTVFMLALVFVAAFWGNSVTSANDAVARNKLAYSAMTATDVLVRGPGVPANWERNASAVQTIGLAVQGSQNELSSAKLSSFTGLSNSTIRNLLGIQSEFYFYVEDLGGGRLYQAGNPAISNRTVTVTRYAVLNGQKVRMRLLVYG